MTLSDLLALVGIGASVVLAAALAWLVVWALIVWWEFKRKGAAR